MNVDKLLDEIVRSINKKKVVIAIDGPSAAGKSTLGKKMSDSLNYDVSLFHMDDFFLPKKRKTVERLETPGGNIDYERFEDEILKNLDKLELSYKKYNCKINSFLNETSVKLTNVIIIEGVYSLHEKLRDYYDYKIFIDVDTTLQKKRIIKRNGSMYEKWVNEWIPLENLYFEKQDVKECVDLIL